MSSKGVATHVIATLKDSDTVKGSCYVHTDTIICMLIISKVAKPNVHNNVEFTLTEAVG